VPTLDARLRLRKTTVARTATSRAVAIGATTFCGTGVCRSRPMWTAVIISGSINELWNYS